MCATVEDMLTLARADEGQLVLVREPIDLLDVASEVRESLASIESRRRVGVAAQELPLKRAARGCSRDPGTREEVSR